MSKVHVPTCDYLIYFISLPDVGARGVVGCHARPPQPVVFACVGAVGGRERQARRTRVVAPPVGEGPEALELGHRCFLQPEGITGAAGAAMSTLVPRSGRKQIAVAAMETASERNSKRAKQHTSHECRRQCTCLKSPPAGLNSCGFTLGSLMALVARTHVSLQVLPAWQPPLQSNPNGVAPSASVAKFHTMLPRIWSCVSEETVEGRPVQRKQPGSPSSVLQKDSGPET